MPTCHASESHTIVAHITTIMVAYKYHAYTLYLLHIFEYVKFRCFTFYPICRSNEKCYNITQFIITHG